MDANGICKLADFGGAKMIYGIQSSDSEESSSLKGSPYWMAPEVIKQTGHGRYIFLFNPSDKLIYGVLAAQL